MAKKPNTDDILSKIRKQGAANSGGDAESAASDDAPSAPAEKPKTAPAGGPADILAKIRAQGAGGDKPAEAEEKPAPKKSAAAGPADIMAAIRAQGAAGSGGSTAAAPAAKAEGTAEAKTKPVAAAPVGDLPPVDEMLRQMKTGKVGEKAAASVPAKPKLQVPTKPAKKAAATKVSMRRDFLTWFAAAWSLLAVTSGAWALGIARFMFPNVLVEPPSQFKVGSPSDYPLGTVSTKYTASNGIWLVHTDQYQGKNLIYALASVCTHLGCTPSWLEGEQKFKCPCHGSGFYMTGINFEGPAPRPLERVGLSVAPDGMLEVDKSVKFQEEKGQWEDAKSFVDASLV